MVYFEKGVFVSPSQFETCFVSEAHTIKDINETLDAMAFASSALG